MKKYTNRRDLCFFIGRRANNLTPPQAAEAWFRLARHLESLGERDLPKFHDLAAGIRAATITAKLPQNVVDSTPAAGVEQQA